MYGEDVPFGVRERAVELNRGIGIDEVACAVSRSKLGRTAGLDGIRAEFIKGAVVPLGEGLRGSRIVLLPAIHAVMSAVFATGVYPVGWSEAVVTAVFNKGD